MIKSCINIARSCRNYCLLVGLTYFIFMTISRALHWLRHSLAAFVCLCVAHIAASDLCVCVCVCLRVYFMYSVHTLTESSLNRAYTHERLRFVAFTNYMPGTHLLPTANWHNGRRRRGRSGWRGRGKVWEALQILGRGFSICGCSSGFWQAVKLYVKIF